MMREHRKCGPNADVRDKRGRFAAGNPGKLPGTRHKATRAAEFLLEGQARELTETAIKAALEGDTTALRLCLDRILPPRRSGDRPIDIELPAAPAAAMDAILAAVAGGDLLLADAERLAALVKVRADMTMLAEIEERITALEAAK